MQPLTRIVLGLAALLLLLGACTDVGGDAARTTPDSATNDESTPTSAPGPTPAGFTVPLISVLDGDSIAVEVDGDREEVRLVGINTPEGDECYGEEARASLIDTLDGVDEVVLVEIPGEDDRDRFSRLLRDVWVDGGLWLNRYQVATGAAMALQGGNPSEAELVEAEDNAWADGLGLWGVDVCGSIPNGEVVIEQVQYDPPGRDFENKNEEWVRIANTSDTQVNMSGWILRDESSQHRYVFAEDSVLVAGGSLLVRTGCGNDTRSDRYWCNDDAVWSNGGDTALLMLPSGTVVSRYKYPGDF